MAITTTTQLSTYSIIKAILQTSSVLNTKFTSDSYYEYEPNHKSASFKGFPYILIRIPETSTELTVVDHTVTEKDFNIDIFLRVEYLARDNFKTYANAIIAVIEGAESTLQSSGYFNAKIDMVGVDDQQIIDQKELVEGTFQLSLHGQVNR